MTRANTPDLVGDVCVVESTRPRLVLCDLVYRLGIDLSRCDRKFLAYWFLSTPGRSQIEADARGTSQSMVKVAQGHIRSWIVPCPPRATQQAIAAFLDRQTAAIDELIEKKERLIDLLQEKRQALITQAVTKGLDPRAPMKESGVDWIGEIPAHWNVFPTKLLGWYRGGAGFPDDEQGRQGLPLPFYKVRDLGEVAAGEQALTDSDHSIDYQTARRLHATVFPPGTIVFAKVGAALLLGRFRTLSHPSCIDNNMMGWVLAPRRMTIPYAVHATVLFRFDLIVNPGAVPSLNGSMFGRQPLPVPPIDEQLQIVAHMHDELHRLDGIARCVDAQVAKLREYRQALISAAVTGQLDVSKEAA